MILLEVIFGGILGIVLYHTTVGREPQPKPLFPPPPATGNLTPRQSEVLALLQASPEGIRTLDVGIAIHAADGCDYCRPGASCKYAHPNAMSVLKALRRKGLAVHRKTGLWQALVPAQRDTGELPAGF